MENISGVGKSQRVVTFLNRNEVDFLDKLGKDALFSSGVKISRAKLIAWLVDFIKDLNISGKGIKSEEDFKKKVKHIFEKKVNPAPRAKARGFTGGGVNEVTPPATQGY